MYIPFKFKSASLSFSRRQMQNALVHLLQFGIHFKQNDVTSSTQTFA